MANNNKRNKNSTNRNKTGLLLKDDDGNAYYIREEVLELCKVTTENELAGAEIDQKKAAMGELSLETPQVAEPTAKVIASLKFDEPIEPDTLKNIKGDMRPSIATYMCPW